MVKTPIKPVRQHPDLDAVLHEFLQALQQLLCVISRDTPPDFDQPRDCSEKMNSQASETLP